MMNKVVKECEEISLKGVPYRVYITNVFHVINQHQCIYHLSWYGVGLLIRRLGACDPVLPLLICIGHMWLFGCLLSKRCRYGYGLS